MMKKEKHIIETKFKTLKTKFKNNQLSLNEIDKMTAELIAQLSFLSERGIKEINGTPIDLYKDRVWWIIEKAGLLPEYKEPEEDLSDVFILTDEYYNETDDFSLEIDDSEFYK